MRLLGTSNATGDAAVRADVEAALAARAQRSPTLSALRTAVTQLVAAAADAGSNADALDFALLASVAGKLADDANNNHDVESDANSIELRGQVAALVLLGELAAPAGDAPAPRHRAAVVVALTLVDNGARQLAIQLANRSVALPLFIRVCGLHDFPLDAAQRIVNDLIPTLNTLFLPNPSPFGDVVTAANATISRRVNSNNNRNQRLPHHVPNVVAPHANNTVTTARNVEHPSTHSSSTSGFFKRLLGRRSSANTIQSDDTTRLLPTNSNQSQQQQQQQQHQYQQQQQQQQQQNNGGMQGEHLGGGRIMTPSPSFDALSADDKTKRVDSELTTAENAIMLLNAALDTITAQDDVNQSPLATDTLSQLRASRSKIELYCQSVSDEILLERLFAMNTRIIDAEARYTKISNGQLLQDVIDESVQLHRQHEQHILEEQTHFQHQIDILGITGDGLTSGGAASGDDHGDIGGGSGAGSMYGGASSNINVPLDENNGKAKATGIRSTSKNPFDILLEKESQINGSQGLPTIMTSTFETPRGSTTAKSENTKWSSMDREDKSPSLLYSSMPLQLNSASTGDNDLQPKPQYRRKSNSPSRVSDGRVSPSTSISAPSLSNITNIGQSLTASSAKQITQQDDTRSIRSVASNRSKNSGIVFYNTQPPTTTSDGGDQTQASGNLLSIHANDDDDDNDQFTVRSSEDSPEMRQDKRLGKKPAIES